MMMEYAIPALLLGLGGSLHCAGMCGPLMFGSLLGKNGHGFRMNDFWLYHTGRIGVYAIWGLVFGLIGSSVKWFGIQQNISLSLGIGILAVLLWVKLFPKAEKLIAGAIVPGFVRNRLIPYLNGRFRASSFMAGLLNGMLPCGLVYVALAGATAAQDPLQGAVFMVFFGMGTLPLLGALLLLGKGLQTSVRHQMIRWYPVLIGCMALLLILRGLDKGNLLSPSLLPGKNLAVHCATE
jgi:sulfite exporter TauE/SafE